MPHERAVALLGAALLVSACASSKPPAGESPRIVASTASGGHGVPAGESASTPAVALQGTAPVAAYGQTEAMPIKVGGDLESGAENERKYLSSLRGPHGETIRYERRGSCCGFDAPGTPLGVGLLDVYEITWDGAAKPLVLYLDMYRKDVLYVPVGLRAVK